MFFRRQTVIKNGKQRLRFTIIRTRVGRPCNFSSAAHRAGRGSRSTRVAPCVPHEARDLVVEVEGSRFPRSTDPWPMQNIGARPLSPSTHPSIHPPKPSPPRPARQTEQAIASADAPTPRKTKHSWLIAASALFDSPVTSVPRHPLHPLNPSPPPALSPLSERREEKTRRKKREPFRNSPIFHPIASAIPSSQLPPPPPALPNPSIPYVLYYPLFSI